ncbi:hypothetical protein NC651_007851 [Populus alba x Populus x berolinensis]|nr:hypothetical protein NC651_007851 [Populus alba x Populus x berolinensis]
MQIKIQSVSIEFLVSLHLSVRLRRKTEKAKVLLYSENEHEKYTEAEMHESFSTLVHRIIVVSRLMPNNRA